MLRRFAAVGVATWAAVAWLALAAGVPGTAHAARTFELRSLETDAVLGPDGELRVTERITYRFTVDDGEAPFGRATRTFDTPERIRGIEVFDGATALDTTVVDRGVAWPLGRQGSGERTFTLRYRVPGAARVAPDVAELVWAFVGDDHPGIDRMTVTVTVPGTAPPAPAGDTTDTAVLRAFGHGPRHGIVTVRPDGARLDVAGVPAATPVEAVVVAPSALFTAVEPTGGPRLTEILRREQRLQDDLAGEGRRRTTGTAVGITTGVLCVVLAAALWFRHGREPAVTDVGEYWREPLPEPASVAATLLGRGMVPTQAALAATVVDLARRGVLTVRESRQERLGPDRTVFTYERTGRDAPLSPIEHAALVVVFPDGGTVSTTGSIEAWAKDNAEAGEQRWSDFTDAVRQQYEAAGFVVTGRTGLWARIIALIAATTVVGIVSLAALGSLIGFLVALAGGLVSVVFAVLTTRRTELGARRLAQAMGLRRYLKDFSRLDEAPVGHVALWQQYLVFAVAFEVADDLARGLAARAPSVVTDPAFAPWYVPLAGHGLLDGLPTFEAGIGGAVGSILAPSSSGSGGGFSGGSAGGGGGGGFGAD